MTFTTYLPRLKWQNAAPWFIAGCICLCSLFFAQSSHRLVVDEVAHLPQIQWFMEGRWELRQGLAMLPGYHLLVAALAALLGLDVEGMRATGVLFGLSAACAFYGIRRHLRDTHAIRSAALFFFLPVLYPYYFLIYTDVLSLALVLWALWSTLKSRHWLSACLLTASVFVRQNNVIWAGLLPAIAFWPELKAMVESRCMPAALRLVHKSMPYGVPVLLFALYWMWNGSISLSRNVAAGHPDLTIHTGNLYYAVFLCLLLFPVEACKGLRDFLASVKRMPWLVLLPLLLAFGGKIKGSPDNYAFTDYYVRNAMIEAIRHGGWPRWLFSVLTALAACGLSRTRFLHAQGWLIYPFACVYLGSSWLIEGRYAIIPLAIWMAFRVNAPDREEKITLCCWAAVSTLLVWIIFTGRLML